MVLGIELHDTAGALRQPVDSVEGTAERAQRRLQDGRRDRRRAVGNRAKRGIVALSSARDGSEQLQHGRNEDGVRDVLALDHVEHGLCVELADEHRRGTVPETEKRPADATDMKHRKRCEAHRVGVKVPVRRGLGRGGKVPVRCQDSLRHTGRSRRIHLDDGVPRLATAAWVGRLVLGKPRLVVGGDANE